MIRRALAILIVFAIAGCTSIPAAPPKGATVAVVSLLGDRLKIRQVGITVFGNSARSVDVSAWNVDQSTQQSTSWLLGSAGYVVKPVAPQAGSILGKVSRFNFTSTYSFAGGSEAARKVAKDAGVDYVLVVADAPDAFSDPFFRTNQYITGYGVYQRRGGGAVAYAFVCTLLVDGKSGDVISSNVGSYGAPRDDSLWIDPESPVPVPSSLGQPRETFLAAIAEAVRKSFAIFRPPAA